MVALGIADDEPDILRLFRIMLDRKGYPIVYMASNGEEAVAKQHALFGELEVKQLAFQPLGLRFRSYRGADSHVGRKNSISLGEKNRALHDVSQLPDISRPSMFAQSIQGFGRKSDSRPL